MGTKSKASKIDIGISSSDRKAIVNGLSALLADSYTLYLMTHNFHWNVTGPQFNSLHAMFMVQYTAQWTALDQIAERIRALGYPAPGRNRCGTVAQSDTTYIVGRAGRSGAEVRDRRRCLALQQDRQPISEAS